MIAGIKEYLKSLMLQVSAIDDRFVYLSVKSEQEYKLAPWISILTQEAEVLEVFQNSGSVTESGTVKTFVKKYTVPQPVVCAFCGKDETEVDAWVNDFFKKLSRYIVVDNIDVRLTPGKIEYTDSVSNIDSIYIAGIRIMAEYGIYAEKSASEITKIDGSLKKWD